MGKSDEGEAKKIRFLERIESAFLNLNIVLRGKGARKKKFSLARNCEIEGGAAAREESKEKGKREQGRWWSEAGRKTRFSGARVPR